ncbi:MAG TPA: hypothetical protein VF331_23120 [Polyangiales bacterium]
MNSTSSLKGSLRRTFLQALPCVAALAACDPQATSSYRGEPLLSVVGSVSVAQNQTKSPLRPALAFLSPKGMLITDVDVHGQFPAEFTLDVYDPPPPEALFLGGGDASTPKIALGYITAVTQDHPATFPLITSSGSSSELSSSSGATCTLTDAGEPDAGVALDASVGGDGGISPTTDNPILCSSGSSSVASCPAGGCRNSRTECLSDGRCYSETALCPRPDSPPAQCTVTHTGDPSVDVDLWSHFAGVSQNYVVLYLAGPLAAHSLLAHRMGADAGLSPGYHLFSTRPRTAAETMASVECYTRAVALATKRYNQTHGTAYTESQLSGNVCGAAGAPSCASEAQVSAAYQGLFDQANLDLSCPVTTAKIMPIDHPANAHISVLLGRDVQPNNLG